MTTAEKRIAIAEFCGWRWVYNKDFYGTKLWGWQEPNSYHQDDFYKSEKVCAAFRLPNYFGDLNAMHEAEECFFEKDEDGLPKHDEDEADYVANLRKVMGEEVDWEYGAYDMARIAHATASNRAEAFYRTISS